MGRISLCQTQDIKSADSRDKNRAEYEAKPLELNRICADSLATNGRYDQADKLRNCHLGFRGWRCKPHSHRWARPETTCRFRLCAFEMRARARRMARRFEPWFALASKNGGARYMVLSEKSCGKWELAEGIKNLFDSFERFRHRVLWTRHVTGCVAVLEVTWNEQEQTWHPHLNVMWEGQYIPQAALLKAWASCSRGRSLTASGKAAGVRVEAVRDLAELFKYVTKLAPIVGKAELVEAFLLATHRVKLVRCYGSFYDIGAEDEDESTPACCPDCGTSEIETTGRVYPEQLDFDGREWRIHTEIDDFSWSPPESPPVVSDEPYVLQYEQPRLFADVPN